MQEASLVQLGEERDPMLDEIPPKWSLSMTSPEGVCNISGGRIYKHSLNPLLSIASPFYQFNPEPVNISAAFIPCQDLYPLTVRLRIFMRPITRSVPLLVQGTSGCQSNTR